MRFRTVAVAAVLALGGAWPAGGASPEAYKARLYAGTIGRHRVFASVEFSDGKVAGRYAYGRIPWGDSDSLALQGSISPDGSVAIDELAQGAVGERQDQLPYVSGRFSGRADGARSRIAGSWSATHPPKAADGKPLAFEFVAFAQTVSRGSSPNQSIDVTEFLDPKLELAQYANAAVQAHAERVLAESRKDHRGPCCDYAATSYSEQLISIVYTGSRDDALFREGLVFALKDGKPARLALGDVVRIDEGWPTRLDALVRKLHFNAASCPYRLSGFAVTDRGTLHLFVSCRPGTGDAKEVDIPIPAADLGVLILPNGPAASVLRAGK
jgi:hypothetical protein